jgi:cytochrome c-type biogenesis protein CcmH/NrfG
MNKPVINMLDGVEPLDAPRVTELTRRLEEKVAKNPTDLRSLILLGNSYYLQGEIDRSIEVFNRAVAVDPEQPDAYYYIGVAQYRRARINEAIIALTKVTSKAPAMVMAHYWLGIALFHCGRYDEAREAFETLLQQNHESHIAHYHAAVICMTQRDYEAARGHLESLVKLGSQDPQVFLRLGASYFQLHKLSEAMNAYRAGLKLNPENAPLKAALAELRDVQEP